MVVVRQPSRIPSLVAAIHVATFVAAISHRVAPILYRPVVAAILHRQRTCECTPRRPILECSILPGRIHLLCQEGVVDGRGPATV